MSAASFAATLTESGSLTIPREAIEELKLQPGDEVQVQLTNPASHKPDFDAVIAELLSEAETLHFEPGVPGEDPYELQFGEIMKQKYRRQGLKL